MGALDKIVVKILISVVGKVIYLNHIERLLIKSFTIGNVHNPEKISRLLQIYGYFRYGQRLKYRAYPLQFSIINPYKNDYVTFSYSENPKGKFEMITEKTGYDSLKGEEILKRIERLCTT